MRLSAFAIVRSLSVRRATSLRAEQEDGPRNAWYLAAGARSNHLEPLRNCSCANASHGFGPTGGELFVLRSHDPLARTLPPPAASTRIDIVCNSAQEVKCVHTVTIGRAAVSRGAR